MKLKSLVALGLLLLVGACSQAAITHESTTIATGDGTSLTISSHVVTGTDPVLVVKVAWRGNTATVITGITWNTSENLSEVQHARDFNAHGELWVLAAPTATTADIVISTDTSVFMVAAASTYSDVDQTTPFRVSGKANGTDAAPTVDIVALNNEMVVDSLGQISAGPDTATADHTERHNAAFTGGGDDVRGASQEKASTGATETMGWTMSAADSWGIAAGALQQPTGALDDLMVIQ